MVALSSNFLDKSALNFSPLDSTWKGLNQVGMQFRPTELKHLFASSESLKWSQIGLLKSQSIFFSFWISVRIELFPEPEGPTIKPMLKLSDGGLKSLHSKVTVPLSG
jgi:hypothetical protein